MDKEPGLMYLLLIITAICLFFFFLWFAIVSVFEKEKSAAGRAFILALSFPTPYLILALVTFPGSGWLGWFLLGCTLLVLIVLLFPFPGKRIIGNETPRTRYDERQTMFSRDEVRQYDGLQKQFYKENPDKFNLDKQWLDKPGLMDASSTMYSPITFIAADASFHTIEQLRDYVDGDVASIQKVFDPTQLTRFLKAWTKKMGAVSVGVCKMQDTHYYSVRGRGKAYGKEVVTSHKFGIALTVEMDKDWLATGPAGPTLMESARQYLNSGVVAIQIAKFIRELGYEARAHIDGNYEVICPVVARDAGLGEIGRMGLLMTPQLGPRVRIAVVTTNIPLEVTERIPDHTVHDFCAICKKCADVCPSQAVPKTEVGFFDGVQRWQVDHEKCFGYWCTVGTDCGRCMSVCPYSHPDNLLHNLVRWGIKNNWLFRRIALKMDDFFYGRKPKPAKIPAWMKRKRFKENSIPFVHPTT